MPSAVATRMIRLGRRGNTTEGIEAALVPVKATRSCVAITTQQASVRVGATSMRERACRRSTSPTMHRAFALWFVIVVAGACQCLVPVDEGVDAGNADAGSSSDAGSTSDAGATSDAGSQPDAGRSDGGGGRDAGFDPDSGVECVGPADCRGPIWSSPWCAGADAGFSCVVGRCVSECQSEAGRTCTPDAGLDCLECTGGAPLCVADTCRRSAFGGVTVGALTCRPGVTPLLRNGEELSFVPLRGASCELSVTGESRGLGQVTIDERGRHFWFIRELGGVCVGQSLPTGAIRSLVSCPSCTFSLEGF